MPEKPIGKVTHYFDNIGVAVLNLTGTLKVGDEIHLVGHGADFTQKVDSMQVEHEQIKKAKKGDDVGLKVAEKAKPGTQVFLVEGE
jgi:translation elongation factor EF-1alpha